MLKGQILYPTHNKRPLVLGLGFGCFHSVLLFNHFHLKKAQLESIN